MRILSAELQCPDPTRDQRNSTVGSRLSQEYEVYS
jgi:hypothetical protein